MFAKTWKTLINFTSELPLSMFFRSQMQQNNNGRIKMKYLIIDLQHKIKKNKKKKKYTKLYWVLLLLDFFPLSEIISMSVPSEKLEHLNTKKTKLPENLLMPPGTMCNITMQHIAERRVNDLTCTTYKKRCNEAVFSWKESYPVSMFIFFRRRGCQLFQRHQWRPWSYLRNTSRNW